MNVTQMKVETDAERKTDVTIWATCHTVGDIEELAAWLELAKDFVAGWQAVCAARAPVKPAAGNVSPIKGKTP